MRVFIDADGCPVVDITVKIAKENNLECHILCDTAHIIERDGAISHTVSKGSDSVDFVLVNLLSKGDVAVTQDYGLASMCLAKGAFAINQNGFEYTSENIDALLLSRHTAQKIRRGGGRLRGPAPRKREDDEKFQKLLCEIIKRG